MRLHNVLASRPSLWLLEKTIGAPVYRKLAHSLANPNHSQQNMLAELLQRGRDTEFGRHHRFADISGADDYASAVPVTTYEDLQPYIERMYVGGEPNLLWPGRTRWFVESSGTTGPKKRLPVTPDGWRLQYLATGKTYVVALNHRLHPRSLLRGKSIFFPGKVRRAEHDRSILVGDITALSVQMTPWYLDFARTPDKATTLDPDRNWEDRLQRIAQATIPQDIVHLAGLPTWLVHFGHIVLEMTGERSLRSIWPNLMATTLGGVNPGPYLPEIQSLIGAYGESNPITFSEVYNGTEGFYATQVDDSDMVLLPEAGLYYEFVERQAAARGDLSESVPLHDVELDRDYALVISTYCGLWRYLIGDTVRFSAKDPYRLKVTGRVSQYLNVAGEELLVANSDAAMDRVCSELGVQLSDYTGVALQGLDPGDLPRHLWLVELAEGGTVDSQAFAVTFDQTLIQNHFDYHKMRNQGTSGHRSFGLDSPITLLLPPATFARWLDVRLDGGTGGQSKVPRLRQDGRMAAEVLRLLEHETLKSIIDPYPELTSARLLGMLDNV